MSYRSAKSPSPVPSAPLSTHGILVHALTGNDFEDHTEHAAWLGDPVPLKLSVFGA